MSRSAHHRFSAFQRARSGVGHESFRAESGPGPEPGGLGGGASFAADRAAVPAVCDLRAWRTGTPGATASDARNLGVVVRRAPKRGVHEPAGGTRLRRTTLCRVGGVRGPHGSQTRRARGSRSPCPDGEGRTPSTGVVLVADVASRSRATLCRGRTTGPSHLRAAPDLPRRSGDGPLAAHHASMVQPGTLACASVNRPPRAIAAAGPVGPGEPILAPARRPAHHKGGVSLHDLPTPRTATWTLTSTGRQARSRRIARGSPSNTCSSWWTPPNGAP